MGKIELHPDFKDFLKLLHFHEVEYLLVGGYAVGYYGYPRATGDMDIWIAIDDSNAEKLEIVLTEFGMPAKEISKNMFLEKNQVIRMGVPPVRIEILTYASGVDFKECFPRKKVLNIDGIPVFFISLEDLRVNKKKSGRHKDLEDLKHLL